MSWPVLNSFRCIPAQGDDDYNGDDADCCLISVVVLMMNIEATVVIVIVTYCDYGYDKRSRRCHCAYRTCLAPSC